VLPVRHADADDRPQRGAAGSAGLADGPGRGPGAGDDAGVCLGRRAHLPRRTAAAGQGRQLWRDTALGGAGLTLTFRAVSRAASTRLPNSPVTPLSPGVPPGQGVPLIILLTRDTIDMFFDWFTFSTPKPARPGEGAMPRVTSRDLLQGPPRYLVLSASVG